jgi:hypothetical protein
VALSIAQSLPVLAFNAGIPLSSTAKPAVVLMVVEVALVLQSPNGAVLVCVLGLMLRVIDDVFDEVELV